MIGGASLHKGDVLFIPFFWLARNSVILLGWELERCSPSWGILLCWEFTANMVLMAGHVFTLLIYDLKSGRGNSSTVPFIFSLSNLVYYGLWDFLTPWSSFEFQHHPNNGWKEATKNHPFFYYIHIQLGCVPIIYLHPIINFNISPNSFSDDFSISTLQFHLPTPCFKPMGPQQ